MLNSPVTLKIENDIQQKRHFSICSVSFVEYVLHYIQPGSIL